MVSSTTNPNKQALLEALDRVMAINLERIRHKTQRKLGWDALRAIKAELEYRRYLTLLLLYPDQQVAPPNTDADEVWHGHILDTLAYAKDCETLFGAFLHHVPSYGTPEEKSTMAAAREKRDVLYQRHFGETQRQADGKTSKEALGHVQKGAEVQQDSSEAFWVCMAEKHNRNQQAGEEVPCIGKTASKGKGQDKTRETPILVEPSKKKGLSRGGDGCVPCLASTERTKRARRTTRMLRIM